MEVLTSITITLFVVTWLTGIMLNSSIVAVYFKDWKNSRHFSVSDKIVLSTALLNIAQQCFNSGNGFLSYLPLSLQSAKDISMAIFIITFSLIYGSFWYSTWLSIYYFLKLVKYSNCFFLKLKRTLSSSIVPILIMTFLGILCLELPFIWTIDILFSKIKTTNHSGGFYQTTSNVPFFVFNLVCGCGLPSLATLICIGLSVASLLGQVWRVHQNSSHFTSSPQIQGLLRAARTMTLQLILNTVLCLAFIFRFLISSPDLKILGFIDTLIILSFPSAQAITLTLGNPKLLKRLFCQAIPN